MTKEDVDAYMSLSNCLPTSPHLYGIARTNASSTDIVDVNPELGMCEYATIGRLASRINHKYVAWSFFIQGVANKLRWCCASCMRVGFDIPTFSLALRDIKAGEQSFNCYCRSVKERRRQLEQCGFVCQWKPCVNATPEATTQSYEKK